MHTDKLKEMAGLNGSNAGEFQKQRNMIPADDLTCREGSGTVPNFKIYVADSELFRELLEQSSLNLVSAVMKVELICGNNGADKTADIIRLQPHVLIHNSKGSMEDDRLIHIFNNALPDTRRIVLGDVSSFMFRVRCNAAGANHVLDRQTGLNQAVKIMTSMIYKLSADHASPP